MPKQDIPLAFILEFSIHINEYEKANDTKLTIAGSGPMKLECKRES